MTKLERMVIRAEELRYQLAALSEARDLPKTTKVVLDEMEQQARVLKTELEALSEPEPKEE